MMKRWILRGLAAVASVAVLAAVGAFVASEVIIRWPAAKPEVHVVAATDPGAVARGHRLATVMGCHDCHGAELTGRLFFDEMPIARVAGPNLSLLVRQQSDADLARAIRAGVGSDGRALWIMPSQAFSHLTDGETADLIAYLRSVPPKGSAQADKQIGLVGRLGALMGQFQPAPAMVKAEAALSLPDLGPQHAQGRDLARACVECHGPDLKGLAMVKSPDLIVAGAYDPADFERLLRTGVAAGDRKLGLMTETAPGRFNAWSHDEIMALHAYLKARAEQS
jgi:cytochrome c553